MCDLHISDGIVSANSMTKESKMRSHGKHKCVGNNVLIDVFDRILYLI